MVSLAVLDFSTSCYHVNDSNGYCTQLLLSDSDRKQFDKNALTFLKLHEHCSFS